MKKSMKQKIAKATGSNYKLNKKTMNLKRSWDEVEAIIKGSTKNKNSR